MAIDLSPLNADWLASPAAHAFAVTPADGDDFAQDARALYIGGAGDAKLTTIGGETVTFSAVPAGSILPVMTRRVFATGTTATLIVGVW